MSGARHQVRAPQAVSDVDHISTARRLETDGHTARDIAKYLGVSRATLYRGTFAPWTTVAPGTYSVDQSIGR
nr:helix-turn-helix domain-containing protein [Mycolicibacterium diernhoferi]